MKVTRDPQRIRKRQIERVDRVADKKKPLDDAKDKPEEGQSSPETEATLDETAEGTDTAPAMPVAERRASGVL